ncbi:MAG: hypothetical protein JWM53_1013, partial [bacterium]|nr:hypothetical protein [bacterium]
STSNLFGAFAWSSQVSGGTTGSSTAHGYVVLAAGSNYDFGCYSSFVGPTSVSCQTTFMCF